MNDEYLILKNVDPARNRWRVYRIALSPTPHENIITLSWGRMNHRLKSRTVTFTEETPMLRFLQASLRRRCRHQYRLVEKSEGFPAVKAIEDLSILTTEAGQMLLFGM
jgi:predicted DNA-binding WGR domain protein